MDSFNHELMYELHVKDLSNTEPLKQVADHIVKEIKAIAGWGTDVQINIEPQVKDKGLYMVSMSLFGLGEPVTVKKSGKQVLSVLRKVRKGILRQIHRMNRRRLGIRKRAVFAS